MTDKELELYGLSLVRTTVPLIPGATPLAIGGVNLVVSALERLVLLGHPNPNEAIALALGMDAIELAAQERARKQYG
jgi:hypothetical protein